MIFFSFINIRTFVVVAVALLSCVIAITFNVSIHLNIVLFGLAIAFPLATSIQMAFKRREKALEYLGLFKSGLLAIHYSFQMSKKLDAGKKLEGSAILSSVSDKLLQQLKTSNGDMKQFQTEADRIMLFMQENREEISARILIRVIRYSKDVLDGAVYLLSLTTHRTMVGLRFYAIFFIHLFAALHPLMVVDQLREQLPLWCAYPASTIGPILLITLYNFQQAIEHPFDQKGADNIKLDEFKLNV